MTGAGRRALRRHRAKLGTKRLRVPMSACGMGSYRRGSSIGLRIDELSAHRDVLTGALDRAAESPGVFFSRLTAPNWNSYWLLSVKDHIGDGVKPGIVNHHNVLDAVHTRSGYMISF